ncbi:VCBS domain-containing protein [Massilia sp. IC2-278]|nr:VCBS domain-containing protein [Massilia sp. IC2-278]
MLQLNAGNGTWTASVDSVNTDTVHFVAQPGPVAGLSAGSFGDLAPVVNQSSDGANAVREQVDITFDGSYGGAQITIAGVSAAAGSAVSAAATAAALAGATYANHDIVDNGNGSIRVVANEPGNQADLTDADFGGNHSGATTVAGHSDGAGWTYAIPAGTFVDAENNALVYTAYTLDPSTGVASPLVDSAALSFNPATGTFSGNGVAAGNTLIEVRATDTASGQYATSQFQLAVTRGVTVASLSANIAPSDTSFSSGAGTGSYTLPATAFDYVANDGTPLTYTVAAVDADGNPIAFPAWLHFDGHTGTFFGNPTYLAGDVRVVVTAHGSNGLTASSAPFTLQVANPNDGIVLSAPIADQIVGAGNEFGLTVPAPFTNPDGTNDGTAQTNGISYIVTANGRPLSDFGLTVTVQADGGLVFGGNPSAAEPYLNILVTGIEQQGGSQASTSFTLNLNNGSAQQGGPEALDANNPGAVTISGNPLEGQILTANAPTDADGVSGPARYQWQVSSDNGQTWQDVAPAANGAVRGQDSTLVLAESESTKLVRVQAFYNDNGGVAESPVSSALAIQNLQTPGSVTVSGALTPGETLTATIADGDGLLLAEPSYQWFRDGVAINGATYAAYTLTNADGGHRMSVRVSYTDDHGTLESNISSGSTATVQLGAVKPTAVNDSGIAVEASGVGNSIPGVNPTGNVLENDFDINNNLNAVNPIASVRSGNAEGLGDAGQLSGDVYTVTGLYGTLSLNRATGAWSYVVDQSNSTVDALAPGQSLQDSFNYTIGDDTGLFDTAVLNITINGANDAPTLNDVPPTAVFTEDVAAAIRTSFSIVDPDGGASFALRLSVNQGFLRGEEPAAYIRPAGLTVTGTDTSVLIIAGNSMGDVQNWLAASQLLYTSGPNQNGNLNDTLTYAVRDGNGSFMNAGTTFLDVTHANNPPIVDVGGAATAGNDFTATFRPRGGEVAVVADDVRITDIDVQDTIVSATVALATGAFDNVFGTIFETLRSTAGSSYAGSLGAIAINGNGTGEHGLTGATSLVLTGDGTRADYENALKTVVYNNSNPNAFSGERTITISVTDDEGSASNTGSFATASANNLIAVGQRIFMNGVDTGFTVGQVIDSQHFVASGPLAGLAPGANLQFYGAGSLVTSAVQSGPVVATTTVLVPWTPVIDMNGDGLEGRDHSVTYTEGQSGVALATSDASITDQDGNIASVVVTLTNPQNGAAEKLFISDALVAQLAVFGVTVSGNNSTAITLGYDAAARPNGVDAAYFQIGLRAVQYVNAADLPNLTPRVVSVTSTDVDGNTGVGASTTINLVGVNDAPHGTDTTVTALEDTALVLNVADFGFTDVDANTLVAVKISSLPQTGSLSLDGVAVEAGQFVSAADIAAGKLVYTPAPDRSGPALASFGFQVQDNGGTANGGVDLDPVARTLSIDVTPVNDAPVMTAAAPVMLTIGENALNNGGQAVSTLVGNAPGQTGVADVDALNNNGAGYAPEGTGHGIAIHALANDGPADGGVWEYSLDGGSTWLAVGAVDSGNALLLRSSDLIRFKPDGLNGTQASFSYYLWDGASGSAGAKADASVRGGTSAFSTGSDTSSITVTHANDAPVVDLNGGGAGNNLATIFRPRGDAVAVVGDIVITDADHLAGGVADTLVSARVTLTGGALDNLFGTTYETLYSSAGASFAGSLGAIAISGNGTGEHGLVGATQLNFSGAGTHADYQDALKTVLYNNSNPNAYSGDRTVQIVVRDASVSTGDAANGLDSAIVTTTIQVPWTPVVDMNGDRAAGRNNEATYVERSAGVAIAASDASIVDQDGNIKRLVVTLGNHPDGASEKLFVSDALIAQFGAIGLTITGNNSHAITVTGNKDGSVFQLALRAIQYVNSSANPSPEDRVIRVESVDMQDNTGVGASTVIHITPVNDAPVGLDGAVSLDEDSAYTLRLQDFGYTDAEGHALAGVKIATLPATGSLTLDGVALTAGQEVSAADIAAGKLVYRPVANANDGQNPPAPTLTFQVRDAGGTANGGADLDATPNTLTLNVVPVNDLPTGSDGTGVPSVTVSGELRDGQVLTANVDIADVDRSALEIAAATFYQWQSREVPGGAWTAIAGATASTYLLTAAEANREVRVVVTYADDLATQSVPVFDSARADAPAVVADVNGDIVLDIDTDEPVVLLNPIADINVRNGGDGPVTVGGMPHGGTLTYEGGGPVVLHDPRGDVNVVTDGPGTVTIEELEDDATVNTSGDGDVNVNNPQGDVNVNNGGPGTVTVRGLDDGGTVDVNGAGPTTVDAPEGDLTVNNGGPGTVTVEELEDDATVTTSGDGDVNVNNPQGDVNVNNGGPGTVTVRGLDDGGTVDVNGAGPTTVDAPEGDLTVNNGGPGTVTVEELEDDATVTTSGDGDVNVNNPQGDVNVNNGGPGTVTVRGLDDGGTVDVNGNGPTTVADPEGDLTVNNGGPGTTTVTGLDDDATVTTSGDGNVDIDQPQGDVNVNNGGPGTVTVRGLDDGGTVDVNGAGPTTVADPEGDLTVNNGGPGTTTVTGLDDDATVTTSGDGNVNVDQPEGSVNLNNGGPGTVTVIGLNDGETVDVNGNGPTTIADPEGDLTVNNGGPGTATVTGLDDDATLTTSGNGDVDVDQPEGSVNLNNGGPGTVTVIGLNDGETVDVNGNGPTTIADPEGDLTVNNGGPGTATVTGLDDDATVTTSGTGNVNVDQPEGSVNLNNGGPGTVTVIGLNDGETVNVTGNGPTTVSNPQGDATLHNGGSGVLTVTGPAPDSQLDFTGSGPFAVDLAGFPANGHIGLNNVDGADVQVLHAPAGAQIDSLGAGDITILAPAGDVHVHNAGTGTMIIEQPADGSTVTKTGTGPALIDHPVGGFTLDNDDSGPVTVQHLPAGSTLVLQGTGPVVVESNLAQGEHVQVDTSGNSNVQLANNGKGTIDVIGDLQLDSGDAMSIKLGGDATTALTVAGTVSLDGTPLNLTLDPDYAAHLGDTITLLDNDGSDAVVGTFAGLAEGAAILVGGKLFSISYVGGTGNDVVLTRVNDAPSGQVTISGSATQHQTLTASNTLGDTDGMGNVSYRWLADGALVAVGSSYVLTQAQVGKAITVVASYTDAEGTVETVSSSATGRVANVNDAPTGAVLIAGNATLGQTLTASNTLADQDGMGTVSYQWQANGADIAGATGGSLTLDAALIGKTIGVVARYTDGFGAAEAVGSAATEAVRDGNGVAPSVEALAPALGNGGLLGDGNGDGILDALQPSVVSMAVPSAANGSSYVTLVAGAVNGKPVADANPLTDVHSVHDAINLPSWAQAPMDGISFTAKVNAPGATENFSLYVDASSGVNGYWAKDASGVLVNLASAAYGGQMVTEGDKIRLDFHITEGSQFDVGVAGDSNIVSNGVAAHASLSLIGYVIDTPDEQGPGNAFD